jgi:hypothetical protein
LLKQKHNNYDENNIWEIYVKKYIKKMKKKTIKRYGTSFGEDEPIEFLIAPREA